MARFIRNLERESSTQGSPLLKEGSLVRSGLATLMRLRHIYSLLFLIGTFLPLTQFWPWFGEHGLDLKLFFTELFSTRIGGFFGLDVIISAIVLVVFASIETVRLKIKSAGTVMTAVIIATLFAGVSSGLPLFLYFRQKHIDGV
jgi:hypothetical protein